MNRKELNINLEQVYADHNNNIVILYGSKYVGINTVVNTFIKNKEHFIYAARPCERDLQLRILTNELYSYIDKKNINDISFISVFNNFVSENDNKKIFVIKDFINLFKEDKTFLNLLISMLREELETGKIMILLVSDDMYYIENDLKKIFDKSIYEIDRIIKINYSSPNEIIKSHKNMSFNDFISYYSIIGGNSELWKYADKCESPKEFICKYVLDYNSPIYNIGIGILPNDLREKSVYNTILFNIANGNCKLIDIFENTGYDRAKISVYLKKLEKRGLIRKCESAVIGDRNNTKKGLYSICDKFTIFWYRFIFGNQSLLFDLSPEKFYKKFIETMFNQIKEQTYVETILDYLNLGLVKDYKEFKFDFYYDKDDSINIIGIKDKRIILVATRFVQPHMAYMQLDNILKSAKKYHLKYDSILLISAVEFDQKLHLYSSLHEDIKLIEFKGL